MEERTCFMIGMPASGKTTYLVSLVNMLMFRERETLLTLKGCDRLEGMGNIREEIEQFNKFQPVARTIGVTGKWIEIPLYDKQENKVRLRIPDLSGEIFRDLVRERRLKKDTALCLEGTDILLFFLNLDTISEEQRISLDEDSTVKMIEKNYDESVIEKGKDQLKEVNTQEKKRVTQTDLVELLQCVLHLSKKRVRVKFILSAWDSIEKKSELEACTPEKCMEKSLSMFFQFLCSNPEQIDYEIWGVSAQGFDFEDPEERKKRMLDDYGNHARVIMPDGEETHDLTRLLCWN